MTQTAVIDTLYGVPQMVTNKDAHGSIHLLMVKVTDYLLMGGKPTAMQ